MCVAYIQNHSSPILLMLCNIFLSTRMLIIQLVKVVFTVACSACFITLCFAWQPGLKIWINIWLHDEVAIKNRMFYYYVYHISFWIWSKRKFETYNILVTNVLGQHEETIIVWKRKEGRNISKFIDCVCSDIDNSITWKV